MIQNPKGFKKFNHVVDNFIILNDPKDRIGIISEFRFGNGLGVSAADHTGISGNQSCDTVSVALCDNRNGGTIINNSKALDLAFGVHFGVTVLDRDQVEGFLDKVKAASVLDFVTEVEENEE